MNYPGLCVRTGVVSTFLSLFCTSLSRVWIYIITKSYNVKRVFIYLQLPQKKIIEKALTPQKYYL